MKTGYMIVWAASIVSLLSGCASYRQAADEGAWRIKPVFDIRHSVGTPESYYRLGRYYQGQKRYGQAMTAYRKALAIDSGFVEARNGMGVILSLQGRHEEALVHLGLAAKQAPNAAHVHNNLGYVLYLSGAYAEAARTLERAVALAPASQAAHTNLALALSKAGDGGTAQQAMAQAPSLQPAENVPASPASSRSGEVRQALTGEAAVVSAVSTGRIAVAGPRHALAQPREPGATTQLERKAVPIVESRIRAVRLAPNVYELRERETRPAERVTVAAEARGRASTLPADRGSLTPVAWQPGAVANGGVTSRPASGGAILQARTVASASPAAKPFRIEVSNGNGVTGMAKKVAGYLDGRGYSGARLTNQKPFRVLSSQVQYRVGYREQAQSLVSALPGYVRLVQASRLRGDISIRVVLGKDLAGKLATFERSHGEVRVALRGPAKQTGPVR